MSDSRTSVSANRSSGGSPTGSSESGATVYMEVVSTTPEACLRSTETALRIGVDCLLGGTQVKEIQGMLAGSNMNYFPFPGYPAGHPTRLGGRAGGRRAPMHRLHGPGLRGRGPARLSRDRRRSPRTRARRPSRPRQRPPDRRRQHRRARAHRARSPRPGRDAFTIGSAVFSGTYSPHKGSVLSQLSDVMADCARLDLDQAA